MVSNHILRGRVRYLVMFLVAVQSLLMALMAIFLTGLAYQQEWETYNQDTETLHIYLQQLSTESSQEAFAYLSERKDLAIWTQRSGHTDGSTVAKYYIDIMGAAEHFSSVSFNGHEVLSQRTIKRLLDESDKTKTIGLDKGEVNRLASLPRPLFTLPVIIDRLDSRAESVSHQLMGIFHIKGFANDEDKERFLEDLSVRTGLAKEDLTKASFGSYIDRGLTAIILAVLLVVSTFILFILLMILIIKHFEHFGSLILLGWSKTDLWRALFSPFVIFSLLVSPIIALSIWILSGWLAFGFKLYIHIVLGTYLSVVLLIVALLLPSLILFGISPLSALHRRLPIRLLIACAFLIYMGLAASLLALSYSLDRPLRQFEGNIRLARQWQEVEDMYVIESISEGDDEGIYAGTSHSLEESFYRLYRDISSIDGVYLAQGEYYDHDWLNQVAAYQTLPSQPFWYMTYSYQYLLEKGIFLSDEEIKAIKEGVRLYLLPDTLSPKEKEKMMAYLKESVQVYDGDITTRFTQDKQFLFRSYPVKEDIFTWSSDGRYGAFSQNPIIFVASSENLYFLETANLFVSGLNGILKLRDDDVYQQVRQVLSHPNYQLEDNAVSFTKVKSFINGLQKDLLYTFSLFGSLLLLLLVLSIVVFYMLVLGYQTLYRERLAVSYLLGYSFWQRYRGVLSLLSLTTIGQAVLSILTGSSLGVVVSLVAFFLQLAFLYAYQWRQESSRLLTVIKEMS
ncbi:DUF1430 domain-containing protein [Streptococcus sp. zg-JUN1979]|uniref:DUF1430 domain-containing protein n=1 Tax=Streptococcus sp. zg-JUN1979 TaxID=3391450 RepID=UPI0039A518EC